MIDFARNHPFEFVLLWTVIGFALGAGVGTCIAWCES